jgi:mannose-6-phosphate isomerase-like protein (cupin superfamily)
MIYTTDSNKEFFTDERCFIIEILNTSNEEGVSIAQARVEAGTTTQLHRLDIDEYYNILEGSGTVEINADLKQEVNKGDVVQIKSGSSQRITNTANKDLVFLCICLPRFKSESYESLE